MPNPPTLLEWAGMMQHLMQEVSQERSDAKQRHEDVLAKFAAQQDLLKQHLVDMRSLSKFQSPESEITATTYDVMLPSDSNGNGKGVTSNGGTEMPAETLMVPSASPRAVADASMEKRPSAASTESGKEKDLTTTSSLVWGTKAKMHGHGNWQDWANDLVRHHNFETTFAFLILGNAMQICLEVEHIGLQVGCDLEYKLDVYKHCRGAGDDYGIWPGARTAFLVSDWFFGLIFTVEVLIKLAALHKRYCCSLWNGFDFLCVVAFYVEKVASALLVVDPLVLRAFRLLRLLRLIRLLRMLESLDALYIMTTAIQGMVKVVIWAVTLLALMQALCALLVTLLLHAEYFEDKDGAFNLTPETRNAQWEMYEYFGTFARSLFSMFELTLANWPPAARLLAENFSQWFMPICVMHKLTMGFAVVGVINGVILQETFKVAATDDVIMVRAKHREQKMFARKMNKLFDHLDISHDGELDFEEFCKIADDADVQLWLSSLDIDTDDLRTMFNLIDSDGNGKVSPHEMVTHMPRLRGTARNIDVMALCQHHLPGYIC